MVLKLAINRELPAEIESSHFIARLFGYFTLQIRADDRERSRLLHFWVPLTCLLSRHFLDEIDPNETAKPRAAQSLLPRKDPLL